MKPKNNLVKTISIGLVLGVVIGLLFRNIAVGISIGLLLGVITGNLLNEKNK